MSESLTVHERSSQGKRNSRRLRRTGVVPAVLYGHGEKVLSLSVPVDELRAVVRHGARVVDLKGCCQEKAFIRELQWDTYGINILHVDLSRVSLTDRVKVQVPVELRGVAPGISEGGVLSHQLHEVEIDCLATDVPEKVQLNINGLHLGKMLHASDLVLPAGAKLVGHPEDVVVSCQLPAAEDESSELTGVAEPELIGRKPSDEDEESGD